MTTTGQIVRLEVENFKSYKGKHIIGPFDNFTCVIGPNGAGKSNVMDAISFVLGLRAAYMRTTNLKELIFAGDKNSQASQPKKAYVEMVFQKNDDEYIFRRTVDDTGTSKYILNNKEVSQNDYDAQLKEFGILTKARNFLVFQGDVEALASKSATELTKLLEQVSGSDQYKKEYDKLKEERDKASASVLINIQKKKGVTAEKSKVKAQTKEAKEYEALLKELSDLQVTHILWRLYHVEKDIEDQKKHQNDIRKEIDEVKKKGKSLEDQLDAKRKEYATNRKDHINANREWKDHSQKLQEKEVSLGELRVKIQHLTEKIDKSRKAAEKKRELTRKHSSEEDILETELENAQKRLSDFNSETESSQSEDVTLKDQYLEEYKQLKNQAGKQSARDQEELDLYTAQRDALTESKRSVEKRIENLEERRRQLNDALDKIRQRHEKSESSVESSERELDEKRNELAKITEEEKGLDKNKTKVTEKIEKLRDQLRDARIGKKENEREARFREALDSMKRLFPGVKGRLTELCTISNNKYNAAVSVALGKNTNAIVTDTERTAIECIQYLKEQRIAVATFLPLDTLKGKAINEKLRRVSQNAKLVLDVLTFDVAYDKVFRYAIGNTLVCDSLDDAMEICFQRQDIGRQKAVTLDGTVINKSGLITGGLAGVENTVIGKRAPATDVDALKRQRDECLAELQGIARDQSALETKKSTVESDIGTIENRIKYTKLDLDYSKKKIQSSKEELKDVESSLEKSRPELETINTDLSSIQDQINEVQERVDAVFQRIFADFNRKIGFDIRIYEVQRARQLQEINEKRAQLQLEISKIENVLEVVRGRREKDEVVTLLANIEKEEKDLKKMTDREKKLSEELESLKEKSKSIQDRLKKAKRAMEDKETEMEEAKKMLKKEVYDIIKEKEKSLTTRENTIENLRNKRADLANRCRIEEIELPKMEADEGHKKKKRKIDQPGEYLTQSESFSVQTQDTEDQVEEVLDFSSLDKSILNLKGKEYDAQEKEFQDGLEDLTVQIDKLAPSAKQSGRAEAVNQRFQETYEQYKEAKDASKEANKLFEEVKKKRNDAFTKAFEPISNIIDSIYKDLTKSEKYPLGGTAHLGMEEPDEPYIGGIRYNAMPPTKRYRDMAQLSGGEKTVAALALLFAIHYYRPSPFFILDEIDAALDNANVKMIGNYVRGRAGKDAQFLVISLKENFFGRADSLVGVYRDGETKSSGTLTFDLKDYEEALTPQKARRREEEEDVAQQQEDTVDE